MVRKRVNKIKKESGNENSPVKVKQEIKSEDLEELEDDKSDLKSLKKDLKSKKTPKVNPSRYFNKSAKLIRRNASKKERGVVYVRCLPHGFYEKQLEGYFGQFGKVTGVYVPKSRKTGRAKGYAFVEFLHPEVAEIAADTMNNYLMFNRLIKTEVVPPEKQRSIMFSEKFKIMKAQRTPSKLRERAVKRHKLICTKSENFVVKAAAKVKDLHKSLKSLGVDYKFKVVGAMDPVKLTGMKAIDPDRSSPKGKSTSPLIKSPIKKKTNKNKRNKRPSAESQTSDIKENKVKKSDGVRKRVSKIRKGSGLDANSIEVKQAIKSEDSPAKKKNIKNTQNKKPPTKSQSDSPDDKLGKLKMVGKRMLETKKEISVDDVSPPVKVKQEIKVKSIKKKNTMDVEDNKNNLKGLKKDFKSKKAPKVNNLRSLSGKLKSKVASKKLA